MSQQIVYENERNYRSAGQGATGPYEGPMYFTISYDFSQKVPGHGGRDDWRTYSNNQVGRTVNDEGKRTPVGYGPVGPGSIFTLDELPEVARVLAEQLGTTPIMHLHPHP